ncbi:hypothetical protein, partial [Xanthomonas sp. MUS 060]|uniref:hypothetical protein n=1 Tax=Xanthomonas sp. MUS 060 TaxID=1588031 RepID=UPI0005F28B37
MKTGTYIDARQSMYPCQSWLLSKPTGTYIDARQSMYPCQSWLLSKPIKNHINIPPFCTLYGFVVSASTDRMASIIVGASSTDKQKVLRQATHGQYFCHATGSEHAMLILD